jgi:hypothetical protein
MAVSAELKDLQQATKDYVSKERTRLQNESATLEKILSGRTGGRGIQTPSVEKVTALTKLDIAAYLSGK